MKPSNPDEMSDRLRLQSFCVTAVQMQAIEAQLFESGFPVAALMEKVAGRITDYWLQHWDRGQKVLVLVGPGHNGGDALVVARELYLSGYSVSIYAPFDRCKPLTADHGRYCQSLGLPWYANWAEVKPELGQCDVILDGVFGFGLKRPLEGEIALAIDEINRCSIPVVSIDLPSGIHTDIGQIGPAIIAETTLCLGVWKRACLQESAQPYLGQLHLIDFDIPLANIETVLGANPQVQCLIPERAIQAIPLNRSPIAYKYLLGQLLVIAGSREYVGAALLTGYGAMASGVGMVTLIVPESIRLQTVAQLPGALVIGAKETSTGRIVALPSLDLTRYTAIACGPGLGRPVDWLPEVLAHRAALVLDADGLNGVMAEQLAARQAPTVITPHPGEFRRLFPDLEVGHDGAMQAAQMTGATVVLKGAKTAIATNDGHLWLNLQSTPALARGGSGDVLTGLMGGLLAQKIMAASNANGAMLNATLGAVWWHAQAGLYAHKRRTVLGVDPLELARCLNPALADYLCEMQHGLH